MLAMLRAAPWVSEEEEEREVGGKWERGIHVHPKLDTAGSRAALTAVPTCPLSPSAGQGIATSCPCIPGCAGIQECFWFKPCLSNTGCGVGWGSGCDLTLLFRFHSIFQLARSGRENQTLLCPGSCVHLLPCPGPCVKAGLSTRPGAQGTGGVCG